MEFSSFKSTDLEELRESIKFREIPSYELTYADSVEPTSRKRKNETPMSSSVKNKKPKKRIRKPTLSPKHEKKKSISTTTMSYFDPSTTITKCKSTDVKRWNSDIIPNVLIKALLESGFKEPTDIQKITLEPSAVKKLDIVMAAETGSGKTLAFAIPMLCMMLTSLENGKMHYGDLVSLIVAPTRELAIQIKENILAAARYTKFKVVVLVGGISVLKQERLLKEQPEIVVGTPGRIWSVFCQEQVSMSKLKNIEILVIDEADRMFEENHFEKLLHILSSIRRLHRVSHHGFFSHSVNNKQRQTFLVSATLTFSDAAHDSNGRSADGQDKIKTMIKKVRLRRNYFVADLTKPHITCSLLTEKKLFCDKEEKDLYLCYLLLMERKGTLIFANSIDSVKHIAALLNTVHIPSFTIHAQMSQKQRLKNLENFTESSNTAALVATDVAARGLDIHSIELVVHYHLPRSAHLYVHRCGRTARVKTDGVSVLLISPDEIALYEKVMKSLGDKDIPCYEIEQGMLNKMSPFINVCRKIAKIRHLLKRNATNITWFEKSASDCGIILDDELKKKQNHQRNECQKYEQELKILMERKEILAREMNKFKSKRQLNSRRFPQVPIESTASY